MTESQFLQRLVVSFYVLQDFERNEDRGRLGLFGQQLVHDPAAPQFSQPSLGNLERGAIRLVARVVVTARQTDGHCALSWSDFNDGGRGRDP